MNFSLSFSKDLLPENIRTAYKETVQKEIAAREPAQGVKLIHDDEPEQLEFNFFQPQKLSS